MSLHATADINHIEAPVTWKAYLLCAFASFGGIYFGYDSGYINGVNGIKMFIDMIDPGQTSLTSAHSSLIVSILSAGTFFGALIAGDVAEKIGRKWTVICGCWIYAVGITIQLLTGVGGSALGIIVAGRLIAGFGVGFESAIVILYMSEIVSCPLLALRTFSTNWLNSAPRQSEELSSVATNSALPLVS
jgi:MFS family permease